MRGPQCKENLGYKYNTYKQKITPQTKKNVEIKPRLGEGGGGVKKPQGTKNIDAVSNKLQGILRIPTGKNVAKNSSDFPNA